MDFGGMGSVNFPVAGARGSYYPRLHSHTSQTCGVGV